MSEVKKLLVTDRDIELVKAFFADNDELLIVVRDLFLGFEMNENEKNLIRDTFSKNPELLALMHERFLPSLRKGVPIGQVVDLWRKISIQEKPDNFIYQSVETKRLVIEKMKVALALLENPDGVRVDLSVNGNVGEWNTLNQLMQTELMARNEFISLVETQCMMLKIVAGQKIETPQEAKERLINGNSNK